MKIGKQILIAYIVLSYPVNIMLTRASILRFPMDKFASVYWRDAVAERRAINIVLSPVALPFHVAYHVSYQ